MQAEFNNEFSAATGYYNYLKHVTNSTKTKLMYELNYWKKRCALAEKYIAESPCDPDITIPQLTAYGDWQAFVKTVPEVYEEEE